MCTIIKHNNTSLAYITVSWISCMFVGCCFVGCNNLYSNINGKCVVGLWSNVTEYLSKRTRCYPERNRYDSYQMNPSRCFLDWAYFCKSTILIEYPIMTLNCFIHIAIVSGCSCVVLIGNCDMLKVSYYYTGILHPHTLLLTHTSSSFMP